MIKLQILRPRSGLRMTESRMLNIAVFAPMPTANVNTTNAVNDGFFASIRMAKRKS